MALSSPPRAVPKVLSSTEDTLPEQRGPAGGEPNQPPRPSVPLRFNSSPHEMSTPAAAEEVVVVHSGGCHCRRVRWRVEAPASVAAWICNCSNCSMRGNTHFVVPAARFELQAGAEEFITTYTFGTHTAKHTFCKACGITSFYTPRSNPDGVAVTVACVDPGTLRHVEYRKADGRNWEEWFERSDVAAFSQGKADTEAK